MNKFWIENQNRFDSKLQNQDSGGMGSEPQFSNERDFTNQENCRKTYEMLKRFTCKHNHNLTLHDLIMKIKDGNENSDELFGIEDEVFNQSFSFSGGHMSFTDLTEEDWGCNINKIKEITVK